jgi:hypothetical protein
MPLEGDHVPSSTVVPVVHLLIPENSLFAALAVQNVPSRGAEVNVQIKICPIQRAALSVGDLKFVSAQISLDLLHIVPRLCMSKIYGEDRDKENKDHRALLHLCAAPRLSIPMIRRIHAFAWFLSRRVNRK